MVKNSREYMKEYYTKNKDKFLKKEMCSVCQKMVQKYNMNKHRQTKYHKKREVLLETEFQGEIIIKKMNDGKTEYIKVPSSFYQEILEQ